MNVLPGVRVPIKIWSPIIDVEKQAIDQLVNLSGLPFVFKHIAAMPDVHLGKGATVGSVIATKGAVIPAAVGVDIGCGMMAVKLSVQPDLIREKTAAIRSAIEAIVPVGHRGNEKITDNVLNWDGWKKWDDLYATKNHTRAETDLKQRAISQIGSLGGGNHFIELCTDQDGQIWVMLHSGSRNIGKSLAELHIGNAKNLMKKMFISLADPELAYYAEHTPEYDQYMRDLNWAQDYAMENREEMMRRILWAIGNVVKTEYFVSTTINCHHNYASKETHYGENVLVTRKGAVRARSKDYGIIPGSMGTRSYIVKGLENDQSFHSCSHGAGRKMSRTKAKELFTLADLAEQTAGVDCRKDSEVIDEIPGAYKDIDQVMENQKDLVTIVAQLKQFMCIKG